jgi:two-component system nitrogen regulation response regulator GlnG
VNCAAIPSELIESELFGHEKGSFTGATKQRIGKFEQAHGGTLFLDEIGDMSLSAQAKVLRALQENTITRVGGDRSIPVDVRVIAATNQPLEQAVSEKTFREDLFYRLNVVRIQLPALRDRQEDIPLLVHYFLRKFSKIYKQAEKSIHQDALQALKTYRWPGNVRELENVIQRAFVVSKGDIILWSNLPAEVTQDAASQPTGPNATPPMPSTPQAPASVGVAPQGQDEGLNSDIDQLTQALFQWTRLHPDQKLIPTVERELVRQALKEVKGNQVRAASLLGITRATLRKRIEKFDIRQEINVD